MFCFGEQLHERKSNLHFETIEKQLKEVLLHFPDVSSDRIVLAYEPVWAIGEKALRAATPEDVLEMQIYIRKVLSDMVGGDIAKIGRAHV